MRRALPLLLLLSLVACGDKEGDDTGGTATDDTGSTSGDDTGDDTSLSGAELFSGHCAACHGEDARGTQDGPDLQREVERHTDAELTDVIINGDGRMEPVDVSPEQALEIVGYLRELFPG